MKNTIYSLRLSPLYKAIWPALALFHDNDQLPCYTELNQKLNVEGIQFVAQDAKSSDFNSRYEPRIFLQGEVQTRDQSWHDFFNALVWQQFPKTKKIINQLQYQLQKQRYPQKSRLPAENMLTLFDENGAIVVSQNLELLELIKAKRWHELFWLRREELKTQLQVYVFGHGLYEKALHPYIGMIAQALLFFDNDQSCVDAITRDFIVEKGELLDTDCLYPLPVLGIPGWWPENEQESFYANKKYFRETAV